MINRTFGARFKEHTKGVSPIDDNYITGHTTNIDTSCIIGREDQRLTRTTKESIYIRVNSPSLNKNTGKYNPPHEILVNNPELKIYHPYTSGN